MAIKAQKCKSEEAVREMMFFQVLPRHENILAMWDTLVVGDELFLVFQYCALSLSDAFQRAQGFLNWTVVRKYSCQFLRGSAHLHRSNIAHRDLTMRNVLLDIDSDACKIADFGLSVAASSFVLERSVTASWYRPPEACLGIVDLGGPQTSLDMWSYGALVSALWTGTHLFGTKRAEHPENDEIGVLQKIVGLLGSPLGAWPEVVNTPNWREYSKFLNLERQPLAMSESLQLPSMVRRTLIEQPDVISFISRFLLWSPDARASSEEALNDVFWSDASAEASPGCMPVDSPFPCCDEASVGSTRDTSAARSSTAPGESVLASAPSSNLSQSDAPSVFASAPSSKCSSLSRMEWSAPSCSASISSVAPGVSAGALSSKCQCAGNCNNVSCMRSKRNYYRLKKKERPGEISFCNNLVARSDTKICGSCKCELATCNRPRRGDRWCVKHECDHSDLPSNEYGNANSIFQFGVDWPWQLRMVAKHAWLLKRVPPCDVTAFYRSADKLMGNSPMLTGHVLLQFWTLAFLKFPLATEAWEVTANQPEPTGVSADGSQRPEVSGPLAHSSKFGPEDYVNACVKLVATLDGEDMQWAHAQISDGQQNILLGPIAFFQKLGMIIADKDKARKTTSKSPLIKARLGKKGTMYSLSRAQHVWEDLVGVAEKFDAAHPEGVYLPTSLAEARDFVAMIQAFLSDFPKHFGHGTPESARVSAADSPGSTPHRYILKHIARKIILWAQQRTPEDVWEDFTMGEIRSFTPDKNGLMLCIPDSLLCKQLTRKFDMPALMISCWACLFCKVKKAEHKEAFETPSMSLLGLASKLARDHEGINPNLRTLAVAQQSRLQAASSRGKKTVDHRIRKRIST